MDPNWTASDAAPKDSRPFYPEPPSLASLPGTRRGLTRSVVAAVALVGVTAIALAVAMIGKPPARTDESSSTPAGLSASAGASAGSMSFSGLPPTGAGPVAQAGPSAEPVPYPAYGTGNGGAATPATNAGPAVAAGGNGSANPGASSGHAATAVPATTNANPAYPAPPAARHATPVATRAAATERETCLSCGTVVSVHAVTVSAPTTGVGAVGGGAVGAVVGSQVAGRGDRTLGAFLGALGGGLVGHQVEKQARRTTVYDVRVRMEDGSYRTLRESTPWKVGAKVNVNGHTLRSRNDAT